MSQNKILKNRKYFRKFRPSSACVSSNIQIDHKIRLTVLGNISFENSIIKWFQIRRKKIRIASSSCYQKLKYGWLFIYGLWNWATIYPPEIEIESEAQILSYTEPYTLYTLYTSPAIFFGSISASFKSYFGSFFSLVSSFFSFWELKIFLKIILI